MEWERDKYGRCCKFWDIETDEKDIERIVQLGYKR